MTSIILAGGKNRRLGRNKPMEVIGGKRLIEWVIERVRLLSTRTLVITSREQPDLPLTAEAEVLVDIYPGRGPLGGIYTGLLASKSEHSMVVACDMPFLNIDLMRYMMELSADYDAVVPRLETGKAEPLCAVYSRRCIDIMEAEIKHDRLEINKLLDLLNVRYIELAECQRFDPQLLTFFNINYPSDVDRAMSLFAENRSSLEEAV